MRHTALQLRSGPELQGRGGSRSHGHLPARRPTRGVAHRVDYHSLDPAQQPCALRPSRHGLCADQGMLRS